MDPERPIPVIPQTLMKWDLIEHMHKLAAELTPEEGNIFKQCVQDFRDDKDFELWSSEAQLVWTYAIYNGLIYAIAVVNFLCPPKEIPFEVDRTDWALPFAPPVAL